MSQSTAGPESGSGTELCAPQAHAEPKDFLITKLIYRRIDEHIPENFFGCFTLPSLFSIKYTSSCTSKSTEDANDCPALWLYWCLTLNAIMRLIKQNFERDGSGLVTLFPEEPEDMVIRPCHSPNRPLTLVQVVCLQPHPPAGSTPRFCPPPCSH